ncbi:hypothetical protein MRB53_039146 [Persea americana]|nr:hypothetical protein MRB53_039146 [Persea americana]
MCLHLFPKGQSLRRNLCTPQLSRPCGKSIQHSRRFTASRRRQRIAARMTEIIGYEGGGLDVLVNNSGNNWAAPIDEYPDAAWDRVLGLNLKAVFMMTQALSATATTSSDCCVSARIIHMGQ